VIFTSTTKEGLAMNLDNLSIPVLGKWIVKYDDVYSMPQFVQGRLIGDFGENKNGQTVMVHDIESIDLRDKILKTYSGQVWKLVGEGRRMLLLGESDILEIAMREMGDLPED